VVLIADKLPIINRFPEKPLMYNVLWKTVIYVGFSLLLHYLEHLIPLWWHLGRFGQANVALGREIVWPHFWAIQLWLIVLIFVYCSCASVIGRQRVLQIFGTPATPAALAPPSHAGTPRGGPADRGGAAGTHRIR
jgi:hypothetical protein